MNLAAKKLQRKLNNLCQICGGECYGKTLGVDDYVVYCKKHQKEAESELECQ